MLSRIPPPRVHFGIDDLLDDDPNQREADEQNQATSRFRNNGHRTTGAGRDQQLSGRGSAGGQSIPYTQEEEQQLGLGTTNSKDNSTRFAGFNRLA